MIVKVENVLGCSVLRCSVSYNTPWLKLYVTNLVI